MNLKTEQSRYKVFKDESYEKETEPGKEAKQWLYYELQGIHGSVYPYSAELIGVFVNSGTIIERIKREKGWRMIQDGNGEATFLIEKKDWKEAAEMVKARKKRQVSPEMREKAKERLAKFYYKKKSTLINSTVAS